MFNNKKTKGLEDFFGILISILVLSIAIVGLLIILEAMIRFLFQ